MTLLWTLEISIRKKSITYEIIMPELNQIYTCLDIFQSKNDTNREDMASCSKAFRKPKNAEEERKLIENGTPKSTRAVKK